MKFVFQEKFLNKYCCLLCIKYEGKKSIKRAVDSIRPCVISNVYFLKEISKQADYAPSRTFYLFTVDLPQVTRFLLNRCYQVSGFFIGVLVFVCLVPLYICIFLGDWEFNGETSIWNGWKQVGCYVSHFLFHKFIKRAYQCLHLVESKQQCCAELHNKVIRLTVALNSFLDLIATWHSLNNLRLFLTSKQRIRWMYSGIHPAFFYACDFLFFALDVC